MRCLAGLAILLVVALATGAPAADVRVRAVDAVGLTVSDAGRSLDFYSRVLCFVPVRDVEVAGASYEELRGVFPVRMRVARLALGREFLELTEYLAPRGRPVPADARANDLVHWQTRLLAGGDALERLARAQPVAVPGHELGFARGVTVRDPDGHALEIVEP